MNPSLRCDFVALYTGHLENIGVLSCADFPNVDISNVFKFWEDVNLTVPDKSFSKFWFKFESLNFIIGNKYC